MADGQSADIWQDPKAARLAVRLVFLVCGIANACWAPMVPYLKQKLGMDEALLGLVLLGLGGGAMAMMPLAGVLIQRIGSRLTVFVSGLLLCVSVPLLSLVTAPWMLAVGLVVFGACLGAMDVSMNAQAVVVEKRSRRSVMSGFHGMFSLGGLLGVGMLSGLFQLGLGMPLACLLVSATLIIVMLIWSRDLLPPALDSKVDPGERRFRLSYRVVFIGMLCFIAFLAEGAVLDWSAVFLHDWRGFSTETAGYGYAAFSVAMAVCRLTGDKIVQRLGPVMVMRAGGLTAAVGFVLAAAAPQGILSLMGFALVGIGASNVVPVMFSAAGRVKEIPASTSIATVATLGYTGILMGPAMIGLAADGWSLPIALSGVAGLLLIVAFSGNIARR